jgi:hypothetical protein
MYLDLYLTVLYFKFYNFTNNSEDTDIYFPVCGQVLELL